MCPHSISVSLRVAVNLLHTCMGDCSRELPSMLVHMCGRRASPVLHVPLLTDGCVIGPRPAMLAYACVCVCVRASCCCRGRLPFVCVWPRRGRSAAKDQLSRRRGGRKRHGRVEEETTTAKRRMGLFFLVVVKGTAHLNTRK